MKRAVRILIPVAVVLLIAGFLLKHYLGKRYLSERVTQQLAAVYGGNVKVADADVGVHAPTLGGFELYQEDRGPRDAPWLQGEALMTDLSLYDLLTGPTMAQLVEIA